MEFKPRVWGTVTDDFAGKTSGSTAAVPHIAKWTTYNGVVSSTSIFNTELNDGYYDQIETNGSGGEFGIGSSAVDGYVPQMLVLFDVIRLFEDTWGTIPSAQDTASKVQWLKDNGNKIVINWYGYCVNSSGGGGTAYMKFATSGGTAFDDTSIVSRGGSLTSGLMTQNTTAFSRMDSNGMFPVLVYGEPGASTGKSILRTDYISITLEMKADTTGVDFFGENSIQLTETTTKGRSPAYLVEYDLSALATALTGWTTASPNNQAFKDLLKAITAEVWAMGTGTDASVMEKTRADFIVFNATNNSYTNQGSFGSTRWSASNIAGQVAKINNVNASTDTNSASMAQQQTTTGNKLYLLVYTPLTSDPANNIQASVSLDFVKLSVDLKRTSDTITGIPIYLPDEWTALVRFAPNWDNNDTKANRRVFDISGKFDLRWTTGKIFQFTKYASITTSVQELSPKTHSKDQIVSALVQQRIDGMTMSIIRNNGTIAKNSINNDASKELLTGAYSLRVGIGQTVGVEADEFLQHFAFFPKTFTDQTNELLLRGLPIPDPNAELVTNGTFDGGSGATINGWTVVSGTGNFANGKAVLTATASGQYIKSLNMSVIPNNVYGFKGSKDSANAKFLINYFDASGTALSTVSIGQGDATATFQQDVTIPSNAFTAIYP
jgi:hypothetical protein